MKAAQVERFLAQVEANPPQPEQKRCGSCGAWKRVEDFYPSRRKLKSGLIAVTPDAYCKECRRDRAKERYHRQKAADPEGLLARKKRYKEHEDAERRRRRSREYSTARRRAEGKREIGPRVKDHDAGRCLPAEPLKAVILERLLVESKTELADSSGVEERRIFAIAEGECQSVRQDLADRFFTNLGEPDRLNELYPIPERLIGYGYLDPKGILKDRAES